MSETQQEKKQEILPPKRAKNHKKIELKNFNNKNSIFFLNNDDKNDLDEENICLFKNCKLKR